jgi:zinc D-Ala-D-Ala carboxypeptidase
MKDIKLSKDFRLLEFTRSETAEKLKLANTPDDEAIQNLKWLVQKVLQPLRTKLGKPVTVSSGFRSAAVNKAVNGVKDSHHLCREGFAAADISVRGMKLEALFEMIKNSTWPYEQVILEYDQNVIHVSSRRPKREALTRKRVAGKLTYTSV